MDRSAHQNKKCYTQIFPADQVTGKSDELCRFLWLAPPPCTISCIDIYYYISKIAFVEPIGYVSYGTVPYEKGSMGTILLHLTLQTKKESEREDNTFDSNFL